MARRLLLLITLISIAALLTALAGAQDQPTTDEVIALVMAIPEIADGLGNLSDYQTLAYNSFNAYGIWQVEFHNLEGDTVAWAQVQPATGKVFVWEAYFDADDTQYEAILPVYREFVANHPDVRALIRGISQDEIYPWWDSDAEGWVSWIGDAGDAIMVAVQFDGGDQNSTSNPVLTRLWFPNLPSYDEWWVASSSEAVTVAFQEVEIAIALRGKSWTTESDLIDGSDGSVWTVRFMADGEPVASATVDIAAGEIVDYEVSG